MSFSTTDTIVAIATPPGRGGIGVVRVSGPGALRVAQRLTGRASLEPRHATLARITAGEISDQAILTSFPAPASYTGENVVEISAHGSPVLLHAIVRTALDAGARLAEPGEFTLRAYLNGRIDLAQAEAVRDLVEAVTPLQARTAFDQLEGTLTTRIREIDARLFDLIARLEASLDFPGEGYHFVEPGEVAAEIATTIARVDELLADAQGGRLVREGAQVVILGRPNAGKSTLFNALAGAGRAIVTDIPGTTRDLLTERVEICGLAVTLVDTAGLRQSPENNIEAEGMARARQAAEHAHLAIVVFDGAQPLSREDLDLLATVPVEGRLIVVNKADLPAAWLASDPGWEAVPVSALTGFGIENLRTRIASALGLRDSLRDTPAITNIRHVQVLERARVSLDRAREAASVGMPEELVAADLAESRGLLEEITGQRGSEATLHAIFERFCIGK